MSVNFRDSVGNVVNNPDISIQSAPGFTSIAGSPSSTVGGAAQTLTGAGALIQNAGNVMSLPTLGQNKPLP